MKKLLSTLVFVSCCFISFAQNQSLFAEFDQAVGQNNTQLSYGVVYKERYRKKIKDNHNFYQDESFKKGSLIYKNEVFDNIKIKYELVDDFIVVNLKNQDQLISIIPEKSLIHLFVIDNLRFVNCGSRGFLQELLIQDLFAIYKKHKKFSKENRDADYRYHTFRKEESFILKYKDEYYPIDSKRDFNKIFPQNKKDISKFYKSNRYLLKNNYTNFVAKLITSLSQE